MKSQGLDRLFSLFIAAKEVDRDARSVYLRKACEGDLSLADRVKHLLKEDESAEGFLSRAPGIITRAFPFAIAEGCQLGRYTLATLVGRGGMGEVWKAYDNELHRPVALKFLAAGLPLEYLTREARLASSLNHPGIVTVHDVMEWQGVPILIMELIEGRPLFRWTSSAQPLADLLPLAVQMAEALAAAHASGIIHGDLKPDNILVRHDGIVKILDFGLARKIAAEDLAAAGMLGGTLRYMSPEQARGEILKPATDVYAFGLVLFELATGRHPFARQKLQLFSNSPMPKAPKASSVNPQVPAALDVLIEGMLSFQPEERLRAESAAASLRKLQQPSVSHRKWKWVAILASVTLLIAAGDLLWRYAANLNKPVLEQITWAEPQARLTAAAISPSGSYTAYANAEGIFLRTDNSDMRPLSAPDNFAVAHLSWFPDEKALLASGSDAHTNELAIWLISIQGLPPRKMRTGARQATLSTDGKRMAFLNLGRSDVWVAGADGSAPRMILRAPSQDTFSEIVWLAGESRFLGIQRNTGKNPDPGPDHSFESIDTETGRLADRIPSLLMDSAAATSGRRMVFLRYYLDRVPYRQKDQVWELSTNPKTGTFGRPRMSADLTAPPGNDTHIAGISSEANGRRMVVLRGTVGSSIFSADFSPNPPRITNVQRVTFDSRSSFPHSWTVDSRQIVFESDRSGTPGIFTLTLGSRMAKALSLSPLLTFMPQATPDGKWVLYFLRVFSEHQRLNKLMRVSVDGGAQTEVPLGGYLDEFRCGVRSGSGCVLRDTIGKEWYVFSELDPKTGKGRELGRTRWTPSILGDWALSPDGTSVALPIHSSREARIRIVSMAVRPAGRSEREITIPGLTELLGLQWATARDGWFGTVEARVDRPLFFISPDGKFTSLGPLDGWAVPSPDGRHLALMDSNAPSNAWMLKTSGPGGNGILRAVLSSLR